MLDYTDDSYKIIMNKLEEYRKILFNQVEEKEEIKKEDLESAIETLLKFN